MQEHELDRTVVIIHPDDQWKLCVCREYEWPNLGSFPIWGFDNMYNLSIIIFPWKDDEPNELAYRIHARFPKNGDVKPRAMFTGNVMIFNNYGDMTMDIWRKILAAL
jgi:hypothetical protein